MELFELLGIAAAAFDHLGIRYLVTGSTATIIYGEPRFTNDIDIVAEVSSPHVDGLLVHFPPPDFDLSRTAMEEAISHHRQFNVIHLPSGYKIDVIVPSGGEFDRGRLGRAKRLSILPGRLLSVATPEDVILKKLLYSQEGGSEKHVRDIRGVLRVADATIDFTYLETWADKLGVSEEWKRIRDGEASGGRHDS